MNHSSTTEEHQAADSTQVVEAHTKPARSWRAKFTTRKSLIVIGMAAVIVLGGGGVLAAKWHATSPNKQDKQSTNTSATKKAAQQATTIDLSITSPSDHDTTTADYANVTGSVTSGSKVMVNGMTANINGQTFNAVVNLEVGDNTITAIATGPNGDRTTQSVTITRTKPAAGAPSITLTGGYSAPTPDLNARISWLTANVDDAKGYYVLRSLNAQPTYPADLVSTNPRSNRSFNQLLTLDGTTYYYQVCQVITSGSCGVYSNVIAITAQVASTGEILTNLAVTGTHATWEMGSGGYKGYGFLLLWSTDPDPTYPSSNTVYRSDSNAMNAIANGGVLNHDFVSGTTYYVRACENLGGKCGSYSNIVTVTAP